MKQKVKKYSDQKNPPDTIWGIFCFKKALVLFLVVFFSSSFAQTTVKVDDPKKSFGTVMKGDVVKLEYALTNTGAEPLLIKDYVVECSCTSAEFEKAPILPGKTTLVIVKFDTKSAWDRQDRIVKLNCNTKDGYVKVRFKGFIKRK